MTRALALPLITALLAACSSSPAAPARPPARPATAAFVSNPAANQCLRRLGEEGAAFTPLPDRYIENGCATLNTVQLQSWPSDHATLVATNLGPVTCEVSQAFVGWARFGVDRAAQAILGSPVRSIETMGSYSCRNVGSSNRRSGHATGAAIDVGAFVLADGRRISVKSGWNGGTPREREFLRVVRQSACKRFATVLGPDYNAAHHDHLHVEGVLAGGGYCR
jgi:hypothetical protein